MQHLNIRWPAVTVALIALAVTATACTRQHLPPDWRQLEGSQFTIGAPPDAVDITEQDRLISYRIPLRETPLGPAPVLGGNAVGVQISLAPAPDPQTAIDAIVHQARQRGRVLDRTPTDVAGADSAARIDTRSSGPSPGPALDPIELRQTFVIAMGDTCPVEIDIGATPDIYDPELVDTILNTVTIR